MIWTLLTFLLAILFVRVYVLFFFFSSRRRHTRCLSDWSSDVCSSDLALARRRRRSATGPARRRRSLVPPHDARRLSRAPRARRDVDRRGAVPARRRAQIGRASCRERE